MTLTLAIIPQGYLTVQAALVGCTDDEVCAIARGEAPRQRVDEINLRMGHMVGWLTEVQPQGRA